MFHVARIREDQAQLLKSVRLTALKDAPYAFATTYEEAARGTDAEWEMAARDRALAPDNSTFFVYTADGEPIGMAAGYVEGQDRARAHLVSVWVASEWRGSGAADRLVTAVCDWAAAIPVGEIALWVAGENERAVRFYERLGFVRVPKESQPCSPDPAVCEVYMAKHFGPMNDPSDG